MNRTMMHGKIILDYLKTDDLQMHLGMQQLDHCAMVGSTLTGQWKTVFVYIQLI